MNNPVFWGNFLYSVKVLKIQKNRITNGCRSTDSHANLIKNLNTTTVYISSLLLFVANNKNKSKMNSNVTTQILDKNLSSTNLYQIQHYTKKESTPSGYSCLTNPQSIKSLIDNIKQFHSA
jgi:hypothetical protein